MGMNDKEALSLGFEFKYFNPYHKRSDIVAWCFLISIVIFNTIYNYRFSYFLNGVIAFSVLIVGLIDFLTSEKIKVAKRSKNEN